MTLMKWVQYSMDLWHELMSMSGGIIFFYNAPLKTSATQWCTSSSDRHFQSILLQVGYPHARNYPSMCSDEYSEQEQPFIAYRR